MTGFKLLAQAADVYVERSVRGSCFAFKQTLGDLVARYDPAGRASQQIEDVELHCGQIYQALALPHLALGQIDTDLSKPGDCIVQMMGAGDSPKDSTDAREELIGIERLDQIVIRTFVQSFNSIATMGPSRQHDDRHGTMTTDLVQQSEAIDMRQHDIKDTQIASAPQN